MKKQFLLIAALLVGVVYTYAQTWTSGTNKLYVNPDTTKVGIGITSPSERLHINKGALKIGNTSSQADRSINLLKFGDGNYIHIGEWEADNMLSFKANKYNFTNGNVGIGVTNPQYKLAINGKLFLNSDENGRSYLHWDSHTLVMGTPVGKYAVSKLYLMSGGSSTGSLYSEIKLFTANGENDQVAKIKLNTKENCWINTPGYIGIGTETPQHKLDVRGTIRANEILVNNVTGADFVFNESYNLRPLSEVKAYVQENQHLPEIPSAAEMQEKGVNINELQIQLLQKVEELTLYIIQQEQRIQELESQLSK
ncbi:MAG: hypothetical protein IJP45_07375 [Paludibacteraceae bacterium]|nr:hypothetical protein [Paludibacteraceae bacterium]